MSTALQSPAPPRSSSRQGNTSPSPIYQRTTTPTSQQRYGHRQLVSPGTAAKRKSHTLSDDVPHWSPARADQSAPSTTYTRRLSQSNTGFSPPRQSTGRRTPSKKHRMTSERTHPAVTLSSLSQAVETARPTPTLDTNVSNLSSDLLPSATYTPGDGDYFGSGWSNGSPSRPRREDRPSASSYLPSPQTSQIKPGAKNSFASPDPQYFETSPRPTDGTPGSADPEGRDRRKQKKPASQKAMLGRALEKANHAVVLDNAANFEGAVEAYTEACNLLSQVMMRTNGEDDRNKLDSIRTTYTQRITDLRKNELAHLHPVTDKDKALPEPPQHTLDLGITTDSMPPLPTTRPPQNGGLDETRLHPRSMSREQLPPRRQSLSPRNPHGEQAKRNSPDILRDPIQRSQSPRKTSAPVPETAKVQADLKTLSVPLESRYTPAPLSPRPLGSPMTLPPALPEQQRPEPTHSLSSTGAAPPVLGHYRQDTVGSTSWLDTIGESGGSDTSSMRSEESDDDANQRGRRHSGNTEAEFDSALDAAIEAAYDQGFDAADEDLYEEPLTMGALAGYTSDSRRNLEIARERAREAEREAAIQQAKERDRRRKLEEASGSRQRPQRGLSIDLEYNDAEAEAEERLLDEMTSEWVMEEAPAQHRSKGFVPRQSDSSSFSQRTYGSSIGSVPTTVGTPLSTVNEISGMPTMPQTKVPTLPNIATNFPFEYNPSQPSQQHPPQSSPQPPSHVQKPPPPIPKTQPPEPPLSPGVRDRRLSGQMFSALKIDTAVKPMSGPVTQQSNGQGPVSAQIEASRPAGLARERTDVPTSSYNSNSYGTATEFPTGLNDSSAVMKELPQEPRAAPTSPKRPSKASLKKNFSSSSLKSAKSTDEPGTPLGRVFSRKEMMPALPDLPGPAAHNFARVNTTGSISFLDHEIHSPTPGSPNPNAVNAPMPLEPCPEIGTLRPFWLMRAIYQTIAHPRGGYISTRLFVPRDIWRVKNVKLKNVDEKVAQLDLLTALLQNLSKVDTMDADGMLEQMQNLELQTDKIQSQLSKKLGAEVGMQGAQALFKAAPGMADEGSYGSSDQLVSSAISRAPSGGGKQYLSGWRKLRGKTSTGPGLPSIGRDGKDARDAFTSKSLPMTSLMNPRFIKRDPTKILGIGPHAHYMAALARLCDAVQVIDHIARQVEDPGLKLSSPAYVGLELSTKNAAEFFGLYICRFALNDIGMMLDKFVKRGSEWVLG